MASQKQIEANQKNALKSTGPKSADGKAIVAKNAVRHGILSEHVPVNEEDADKYREFWEVMQSQLKPKDIIQGFLADRIISTAWRMRRVVHVETLMLQVAQSSYYSDSYRDAFEGKSGADMAVLSRYERSLENALFRALKEFKMLKEQSELEVFGMPI